MAGSRPGTPAAAAAGSAVVLGNVSKTYPGASIPAVDDISLEVRTGEVFTFLGPSGCGKTTTLRMVAGLETPDSGAISIAGNPVVDSARGLFVPTHRRDIGMVFQSYAIWPHMTVGENVAYPLRLRRRPGAEVGERVRRMLELVGLGGLENRPAPLLSGGQQQRVALARALVYEPALLLLDEPFSNLDATLREQMRLELKLLRSRVNVTIVFVTHDQTEALSLSDRVAVMDTGHVRQVGDPRELYEHPADAHVRDFIGKTALLKGSVLDGGATADREVAVSVRGAPGAVLRGSPAGADPLRPGEDCYLAVRPEHILLCRPDGGELERDLIPGRVEARLFEGDRTDYRIQLPDQDPILVRASSDDDYREGEPVLLRLRADRLNVWPARTGGSQVVEEAAPDGG